MLLKEPRQAEQGPLIESDVDMPHPGPGEVRIKVSACGVCHTDLHTVEGDLELPLLPVIPGHQIAGKIDEVGPGVLRFNKGDRVGVPWLYSTCGHCEYCRRELENLCDKARFTGLHVNGGFAPYTITDANFTYALDFDLTDVEVAPLLCAGIIGYRAFKLSEARQGCRLGLYGFGASAHITIQVAIHCGCEVYVFTRSHDHRRHALELGAVWAGSAEDNPPVPMHSSIIFAPAGGLVPKALKVLDKGGTLALAGIHMSPIPRMEYSLIYGERKLRSVANSTRNDAIELLKTASEVPIRTDVEVYPLKEANEVLKRLKRSEIRGAAVLKID